MERGSHQSVPFVELANRFEHLIEAGAYKEGDRLPSVREIALAERLNPNTVARALQKVASDGYCVAVEKKGYFVSRAPAEKPLVGLFCSLLKEGHSEEEIQNALKEALKEVRDD